MKLFRSILFWLFFIIPMVLGTAYYLKFASDQYVSTAHFTIEQSGQSSSDPLGILTGLPGNVTSTRDALIIKDFISSREVIERTRNEFDLKKLYARGDKDWLSRLDEKATIEDIVEYWQQKVNIEFDTSSGIARLSVMAFEPIDAVTIIKAILKSSENLINNLSEKSRQDSLSFARRELRMAETSLKEARTNLRQFRDSEQALNPEKNVNSKLTLVAALEADLAKEEARLDSLRKGLHENTPKVRVAKNRVSALKRQIQKERARSNLSDNQQDAKTMSSLISKHEALLTEQGFAEKSYSSTLLNLENARISATQQQRYLTIIVQPQLPEKAAKPKQPHDFLVLLFACLLLWGISSLIIASIKDHAGWM